MKPFSNNYLGWTIFGIGLMVFFNFNFAYHSPISLDLELKKPLEHKAEIRWDSGQGINDYEKIEIDIKGPTFKSDIRYRVSLPQQPLQALSFTFSPEEKENEVLQASLVDFKNEKHALATSDSRCPCLWTNLNSPHRTWSAAIFAIQLLTAFLVVFFTRRAYLWIHQQRPQNLKEVLQTVFVKNQRVLFWCSFLSLSTVYLCWSFAFWPVAMTNDSWSSYGEAITLNMGDWHPYTYTIYILMLLQFGLGLGALSVAQALATAALLSSIFFYCYRRGVPLWLLILFQTLSLCSIPIGLYSHMMWKDVPFSLGILALSFMLFKARLEKDVDASSNLSPLRLFYWSLILIAACTFRKNGMAFYVMLPLLTWGLWTSKNYLRFLTALFGIYLVLQVAFVELFHIRKTNGAPYQMMATALAIVTHPAFFSSEMDEDIKTIEEATGKTYQQLVSLYPAHLFSIWDESKVQQKQWEPSGGETEHYNKKYVSKLIYKNPSIFVASRTYGFFHSLGIDSPVSGPSNHYFENPMQLHGTNLLPPGRYYWGTSTPSEPVFPSLRPFFEKWRDWSYEYNGPISPCGLTWNLIVALMLLVAILFFETGFSAIGLFACIHLGAALAVFVAGAGESWRYFYYLYLSGVVAIPLWVCHRKAKKQK